MTEYKIDRYNTTWVYQTYNKKYTTPRIFMSYDFNLSLMIASVITSIVLALMPSIYNPIMILDWMLAFAKKELILPTGPRLYVGIMFNH